MRDCEGCCRLSRSRPACLGTYLPTFWHAWRARKPYMPMALSNVRIVQLSNELDDTQAWRFGCSRSLCSRRFGRHAARRSQVTQCTYAARDCASGNQRISTQLHRSREIELSIVRRSMIIGTLVESVHRGRMRSDETVQCLMEVFLTALPRWHCGCGRGRGCWRAVKVRAARGPRHAHGTGGGRERQGKFIGKLYLYNCARVAGFAFVSLRGNPHGPG